MELLESDDPVKGQLLRKSKMHRDELEENVKLVSERTEKMLTNALIIGGALAVTYFVVRQFSSPKKKRKVKTAKISLVKAAAPEEEVEELETSSSSVLPGIVSQISTTLASQATVFLLDLAREKLGEYLQSQAEKKKPE